MPKNLREWLECILLAALIAVAAGAFLLERKATAVVASLPQQITDSRNAVIAAASSQIESARKDVLTKADRQLSAIRATADNRLAAIEGDARDLGFLAVSVTNERTGQTLGKVDRALELLTPAAENASKVEASANALLQTYNALPGQLAAEIRPSWNALQPEITCRQLDGSGYGGCWHSRITALMGEAANVGGTFTKRFPEFSASLSGIAKDVHGWTDKYVMPHPMTTGDKFKAAGKVVIGLGATGWRAGLF